MYDRKENLNEINAYKMDDLFHPNKDRYNQDGLVLLQNAPNENYFLYINLAAKLGIPLIIDNLALDFYKNEIDGYISIWILKTGARLYNKLAADLPWLVDYRFDDYDYSWEEE